MSLRTEFILTSGEYSIEDFSSLPKMVIITSLEFTSQMELMPITEITPTCKFLLPITL